MHISYTKHTMPGLFSVCSIRRLNYSEQEPKTLFPAYDFDTPMTLKQSQGHKTPSTRKSQHKKNFQIQNHVDSLPLICAKVKNIGVFIIYLMYLLILQISNLIG